MAVPDRDDLLERHPLVFEKVSCARHLRGRGRGSRYERKRVKKDCGKHRDRHHLLLCVRSNVASLRAQLAGVYMGLLSRGVYSSRSLIGVPALRPYRSPRPFVCGALCICEHEWIAHKGAPERKRVKV